MWFKLNTTFTTHLGSLSDLTNSWSITRNLTNFSTTSAVTSVAKDGSYSATFTLNDGCTYSSHSVTMGGSAVTSGVSYSDGTLTVNISAVTGAVVITAIATGASSGGSGETSTPVPIEGYTQLSLSYAASDWALSRLRKNPTAVADGDSTTRLVYNTVLDLPDSGRIKVVCNENYQWSIRVGTSTALDDGHGWFNSGDEAQTGLYKNTKFMIALRKTVSNLPCTTSSAEREDAETTITKDEISTIAPKLYTKDTYTAEIDTSDYQLVTTLNTDESNWVLATAGETGPGAEGSNTKRLCYNITMDASQLHQNDVIMVKCAEGFQWAIRSGTEGNYPNNSFWYPSGTIIRLSDSGDAPQDMGTVTHYVVCFCKLPYNSTSYQTCTKDMATTLNASIYTAKSET